MAIDNKARKTQLYTQRLYETFQFIRPNCNIAYAITRRIMRVALHLSILFILLWGCQDPTTPPDDECDPCLPLAYPDENFYYTFDGEKIPLTISSEKISLKFDNSATPEQIHVLFIAEPALGDTTPLPGVSARGFYAVQITSVTDVEALVKRLDDRPEIAIVNPVFFSHDSLERIPYDHFVVKFKPSVSRADIDTVNKCNHVEIVGVVSSRFL